MDLTEKDRFIIANQLKILEKLYPEKAKDYQKQLKAIESGYALEYERLLERFSDGLSKAACQKVCDILNMYRALKFSFDKAKENGQELGELTEQEIKFPGFDGNNETSEMLYTRYLIKDLGLWPELADDGSDFNSHCPNIERYREQLEKWEMHGRSSAMTPQQIADILSMLPFDS